MLGAASPPPLLAVRTVRAATAARAEQAARDAAGRGPPGDQRHRRVIRNGLSGATRPPPRAAQDLAQDRGRALEPGGRGDRIRSPAAGSDATGAVSSTRPLKAHRTAAIPRKKGRPRRAAGPRATETQAARGLAATASRRLLLDGARSATSRRRTSCRRCRTARCDRRQGYDSPGSAGVTEPRSSPGPRDVRPEGTDPTTPTSTTSATPSSADQACCERRRPHHRRTLTHRRGHRSSPQTCANYFANAGYDQPDMPSPPAGPPEASSCRRAPSPSASRARITR